MDEEIDVMFGPDKRTPEGGVSDSEVIDALGISMSDPTGAWCSRRYEHGRYGP
jgi:hypothetical protein